MLPILKRTEAYEEKYRYSDPHLSSSSFSAVLLSNGQPEKPHPNDFSSTGCFSNNHSIIMLDIAIFLLSL